MSGAVVRRPDRKATARAERRNRERNRLRVYLISRNASVRMRFGTCFLDNAGLPPFRFKSCLPRGRHYHSICSTGVGCSLRSMAATVPFLMWMTRSAMGVRAVLWVMTTTVMPSLRQVSWRSLSTSLPVM